MKLVQNLGLLFVLLTGLAGCPFENAGMEEKLQPKGSLFIIGGGKRPVEMLRFMLNKSNSSSEKLICILPWASAEQDSSSYYAIKQFEALGHTHFWDLPSKDLADWTAEKTERFLSSSLIYIPGGDQQTFMTIAKTYHFDSLLRAAYYSGSMIAGTSAGAAIMSKPMITGTALKYEEYYPTFRTLEQNNLDLEEGIGLLPENIIIDQHFIWRSRYNRLLTATIEHPEWIGWGIEESTAAFVRNDTVEVVGLHQLITFKNRSGTYKEKGGLLGAEDIQLSIYLPGEKFILNP